MRSADRLAARGERIIANALTHTKFAALSVSGHVVRAQVGG